MYRKAGFACAIAVSMLWGISYIGAKSAMSGGMDTFSLISVRFAISTLAIYGICRIRNIRPKIEAKDILRMIVSAMSGITVYYYCELQGIKHTSASVASLVISTIPVWTLLSSVIFHGKRTSPLTWLGVAMSVFGVYLLVFTDMGSNTFSGILFLVGACVCWVVYLEVTEKLLVKYSGLNVTFWQSVIGFVTTLPLVFTENVRWTQLSASTWLWSTLFLGLVCSSFCFLMNNFSIAVLKPQLNVMFLNLSPVATAAAGYIILGEKISFKQGIGGVIIIASLFVISAAENRIKKGPGNDTGTCDAGSRT